MRKRLLSLYIYLNQLIILGHLTNHNRNRETATPLKMTPFKDAVSLGSQKKQLGDFI